MGSGGSKSQSNVSQNNNKNHDGGKSEQSKQAVKETDTSAKATNGSSSVKSENAAKPPKSTEFPQKSQKKPDKQQSTANSLEEDEELELPEFQQQFDMAIRFSCKLMKNDSVDKYITGGVLKLELPRALPYHISLFSLLGKLKNLQVLDLSGNQLGPAGFRAVILSLCQNSSVTTLNLADNHADTDSAESLGKLLSSNKCLTCLDVSSNNLGKDYFSRCVGPALGENTALQILKCESIGSTDLTLLGDNLKKNSTLTSLNINSNELRDAKSFIKGLTEWLVSANCCLKTLEMRNTGIKDSLCQTLADTVIQNSSLNCLNISANQSSKCSELLNLVCACVTHPCMKELNTDDVKVASVDSWTGTGSKRSEKSNLHLLSMNGCSLKDDHFKALMTHLGDGYLASLKDLIIGNNPDLTNATLESIKHLTLTGEVTEDAEDSVRHSGLTRLNLSHNNTEDVAVWLQTGALPQLNYLNLRRSKISSTAVGKLNACIQTGGVTTLVLDNLKLAGSDVLTTLLGDKPKLAALSLSGCQLNDTDIQPLSNAIKAGLPVHMLKLSGNRLSDEGVRQLCDAIQSHKTHSLALIDLSMNNIEAGGAERLSELLCHRKHKSQIHSINVASNNIKSSGAVKLVHCLTKSSLLSLKLDDQKCSYEEEEMDEVFNALTKTLGIKVTKENDSIKAGCSNLPKLPAGVTVKLQGLGGQPGELGCMLDSSGISTDYEKQASTKLTLQNVLEISAALKGMESSQCLLSSEEWETIADLKREAPSWLKVASHRDKAVYLTNLPASITIQKMEGVLEMEADCNVDEVCLMKDPVTRKNNGNAWALMSDEDSAQRALDFYHRGEAQVFSQPFTVSKISVLVDDSASSEADAKAKEDMTRRLQDIKKEQAAHKDLIQRTYIESQERHAYRLAHPAYADGRIW